MFDLRPAKLTKQTLLVFLLLSPLDLLAGDHLSCQSVLTRLPGLSRPLGWQI